MSSQMFTNRIYGGDISPLTYMSETQINDVVGQVGAVDVTTALQDAVNAAEAQKATLVLPSGRLLTSAPIVVDSPIRIVGQGSKDNDGLTEIVGSHTDGPIFRIKCPHVSLEDFTLMATATRRVATRIIGSNYSGLGKTRDDQNYGIWIEGDDNAAEDVDDIFMRNVWVHNQPNDGIMMVGRIYGSYLLKCGVRDSIGHGIVIDCGDLTDRTNIDPPGVMCIETMQTYGCTGHGLLVGTDNISTGGVGIRIIVNNFDTYNCCSDASICYQVSTTPYVVFMFCDNSVFRDGAVDGNGNSFGGILMGGRNNFLYNNRYLDTAQPVYLDQFQVNSVARDTDGIVVDGLFTTQSPALVHTNGVEVDSTCSGIRVYAHALDGNFTNAGNLAYCMVAEKPDERDWRGVLEVKRNGIPLVLDRETTVGQNIQLRDDGAQYGAVGGQRQVTVSTSAVTLYPSISNVGCFVLVSGTDGGSNQFWDLVHVVGSIGSGVVNAITNGSPAGRTYSVGTGDLQLAMASGSYTVSCTVIEARY